MKAIKSLIVEEINEIKLQKGCISSYPKSIMDLVFSEVTKLNKTSIVYILNLNAVIDLNKYIIKGLL